MKKLYSKVKNEIVSRINWGLASMSIVLVACLDIEPVSFIELDANFAVSQAVAQVGDTIQFFQFSSQVAASYEWDFGDGSTSAEANPKHIYQDSASIYNVRLISTKADGVTKDTITRFITVVPRTQAAGNFQILGGADTDDTGFSYSILPDGYIFAGRKDLNTLLLIRTDRNFVEDWRQEYSSIADGRGEIVVTDINPTIDGGFVLVGYYDYNSLESDSFILKTDFEGNEEWLTLRNTVADQRFNRVIELNESFLVVGYEAELNGTTLAEPDLLIVEYGEGGIRLFDAPLGNKWRVNDFIFTFDGSFILAVTENRRPVAYRLEPDFGTAQKFEPRINGRTFNGEGLGVTQAENGDILLAGKITYENAPADSMNAFLARFDDFATQRWIDQRVYYHEQYSKAIEGNDGTIYATGVHENPITNKDILVARYSPFGQLQGVRLFGGAQNDQPYDMSLERDGTFSIVGATQSFSSGLRDFYYIRINNELQ